MSTRPGHLVRSQAAPVALACLLLAACGPETSTPLPEPASRDADAAQSAPVSTACADRQPLRKALFGDLHVHTTYSFDAYSYGVTATPEDAYRFAKGEPMAYFPRSSEGKLTGEIRIDRPLDFLAVTDHAEFLGEYGLCNQQEYAAYDTAYCMTFRAGGREAMIATAIPLTLEPAQRMSEVCRQGDKACLSATRSLWRNIVDAAESAQDHSNACAFTALVGYEYTGSPASSNYHRNVLFRSALVPDRPVSQFEARHDYQLWEELGRACTPERGCEFLTIPHNSNLSNGRELALYANLPLSPENRLRFTRAKLRYEPVMEIFQHKGNSECENGFPGITGPPDELCALEQIRPLGKTGMTGRVSIKDGNLSISPPVDNPTVWCKEGEVGFGGMQGNGCLSRNDFLRSALLSGLQEQQALGINPMKYGVVASTDTHMATAGATKESEWQGHILSEWNRAGRLSDNTLIPGGKLGNPGGLTGVWAEENSRDAIFSAIQRREVFGTSGPRIRPRLFGGWGFGDDLCDDPQMIATAYRLGVPMGADLPPRLESSASPRFLATALADPAGDATPLQKLQIIKGWVSPAGGANYMVYDVIGDLDSTAGVDLQTGDRFGTGHSQLCAVFEDPDFDPGELAYYYLRAAENPSPRWSLLDCLSYDATERPEVCDEPEIFTSIQELAWTSPIWYSPPVQLQTESP